MRWPMRNSGSCFRLCWLSISQFGKNATLRKRRSSYRHSYSQNCQNPPHRQHCRSRPAGKTNDRYPGWDRGCNWYQFPHLVLCRNAGTDTWNNRRIRCLPTWCLSKGMHRKDLPVRPIMSMWDIRRLGWDPVQGLSYKLRIQRGNTGKLKKNLKDLWYEHNWDAYTAAKTEFIRRVCELSRKEMKNSQDSWSDWNQRWDLLVSKFVQWCWGLPSWKSLNLFCMHNFLGTCQKVYA